jgi:hypothetical protein
VHHDHAEILFVQEKVVPESKVDPVEIIFVKGSPGARTMDEKVIATGKR